MLPKDQGSAQSVILEFDKADTGTLGDVSREAVEKHLAMLLDGRESERLEDRERLQIGELAPSTRKYSE